jgi:hypothetical protein
MRIIEHRMHVEEWGGGTISAASGPGGIFIHSGMGRLVIACLVMVHLVIAFLVMVRLVIAFLAMVHLMIAFLVIVLSSDSLYSNCLSSDSLSSDDPGPLCVFDSVDAHTTSPGIHRHVGRSLLFD